MPRRPRPAAGQGFHDLRVGPGLVAAAAEGLRSPQEAELLGEARLAERFKAPDRDPARLFVVAALWRVARGSRGFGELGRPASQVGDAAPRRSLRPRAAERDGSSDGVSVIEPAGCRSGVGSRQEDRLSADHRQERTACQGLQEGKAHETDPGGGKGPDRCAALPQDPG